MRRPDDRLIAHNRTSVYFLSGPVEVRDSTHPLEAVQQLVRNAVMHRTYEDTNAPTHVTGSTIASRSAAPLVRTARSTPTTSGSPGSSTIEILGQHYDIAITDLVSRIAR